MKARVTISAILIVSMLSGCAYIQKAKRTDELEAENASLRNKIGQLQKEKTKEVRRIYEEKDKELSELERAKRELEESLKQEIGEYKAKLQMTERGLVITFVSEIFFDSGKDKLKSDGMMTLNKVAEVLNKEVPNSNMAVEGHTDNDPIKHSGWKSNWELSSARALAVLHYLISEGKIRPQRLSANGYGEFHPVAPNDTVQNKQNNRRVEIVILPSKLSKVKLQ
ncbi:MAG: flagellar motor protein MotB [Nitrospirae bacterium]|nr:flagellar motor protein MotB [Nitrospirota bacterium]